MGRVRRGIVWWRQEPRYMKIFYGMAIFNEHAVGRQ